VVFYKICQHVKKLNDKDKSRWNIKDHSS
jgi:hypothetical protein